MFYHLQLAHAQLPSCIDMHTFFLGSEALNYHSPHPEFLPILSHTHTHTHRLEAYTTLPCPLVDMFKGQRGISYICENTQLTYQKRALQMDCTAIDGKWHACALGVCRNFKGGHMFEVNVEAINMTQSWTGLISWMTDNSFDGLNWLPF